MIHTRTQSGFSLVETLVAITILLIVIVGPMKISTQTARSSTFANEQVGAFFLAQEGVEMMERVRDDYILENFDGVNPNPWTDMSASGLLSSCYAASGCGLYLDNGDVTLHDCTASPLCVLYYDTRPPARSLYIHNTAHGGVTPYTRKINLYQINANEIRVVSQVVWRTGFLKNEQTVTVETRLFNVYGNT
jgi:prepilin-type N-terminal cleavage/methylation domain-containing protein